MFILLEIVCGLLFVLYATIPRARADTTVDCRASVKRKGCLGNDDYMIPVETTRLNTRFHTCPKFAHVVLQSPFELDQQQQQYVVRLKDSMSSSTLSRQGNLESRRQGRVM